MLGSIARHSETSRLIRKVDKAGEPGSLSIWAVTGIGVELHHVQHLN